ncbi:diguanylate cyclase [Alcanivorax sp. DP30]|uniref:GGDEF domain-containing protein n=1 Tax=Alcanivorax sp. DP30 TaxID=2606217 RepID=UPI0013711BF5|nr:diguanylate cyclase [Alcanivorax sp. DP30]
MTANQTHNPLPTGNDISLPWHLRLPAPLEQDFLFYSRNSAAGAASGALMLIALLLVCALLVESTVGSDILMQTWRPRLFTLMVTGGCIVLCHQPRWREWLQPCLLVLSFTISLSGVYMGVVIDHPLSYVFFLQTPLSVVMISTLFRLPLHRSAFSAVLMTIAMIGGLFFAKEYAPYEHLSLALLSLAFISMSLFGQYVYEKLLRKHFLSEHVLYQHRDELHSANQVLESQATVDGMTGCINRRGMEARLNHLYHLLKQQSPDAPERINLLLFDIDFFKQYNDTYGHPAGDECLKKVSAVPLSMVQAEKDFAARYGGEEFVIVLTDSSFNDALVFAERMRNRVEQLGIPHSGSRVNQVVTISIGVACSDGGAEDGGVLLKQADEALYQAKGAGRNRVAMMSSQGMVEMLT